ncbi:hypothetical protein HK102_009584, partial [Quaeritorhiza haematococci]
MGGLRNRSKSRGRAGSISSTTSTTTSTASTTTTSLLSNAGTGGGATPLRIEVEKRRFRALSGTSNSNGTNPVGIGSNGFGLGGVSGNGYGYGQGGESLITPPATPPILPLGVSSSNSNSNSIGNGNGGNGKSAVENVKELLDMYTDEELYKVMTNLAGHCMATILECFDQLDNTVPNCIIAYTIKGYGLPIAGHRDNHGGQLNATQISDLQKSLNIPAGSEWEALPFSTDPIKARKMQEYIEESPFHPRNVEESVIAAAEAGSGGGDGKRKLYHHPRYPRRLEDDIIPVPLALPYRKAPIMSTQEAFGRIMTELGRAKHSSDSNKPEQQQAEQLALLSDRIVTTSPDVTTSTNMGGFVNNRGVFGMERRADVMRIEKVVASHKWDVSTKGQHFELGIAEMNLFLALASLGLSHSLFGRRLLPVGTLYDPFIARGLDALNYAAYMDARFLLVATPSGVTLAP